MTCSSSALRQRFFEATQALRKTHTVPPLPDGVTPTEGRTLMILSMMERRGETMRPSRCAHLCHATPSALSQTLGSLESKGLIERVREGSDSRAVEVKTTQKGRDIEQQGRRMHDVRLDEMVEYLGEDDVEQFVRLIERVSEFERTHPWTMPDGSKREGERPCE